MANIWANEDGLTYGEVAGVSAYGVNNACSIPTEDERQGVLYLTLGTIVKRSLAYFSVHRINAGGIYGNAHLAGAWLW